MNQRIKIIYDMFGNKLIGSSKMKLHVCEVVSQMPEKIIKTVTQTCWFMASMDDAWAFTFTGNDLKDNHLVFLSDDLLTQEIHQIHYTIAHEIGHVVLNHRNSTFSRQTKKEIAQQEREADAFAKKYIV